jgi:peptidoglycan/LPS O-acetylase OafA/YrhL
MKRLDQLTALRFFAALAVLASHLWPLAEYPNALQPLAQTLFHEGYAGVSFFFMLSAISLPIPISVKLAERRIGLRHYLVLRLARILPLHWLVGVPLAIWRWGRRDGQGGGQSAAASGLGARADWYFTINEPSWSLSDEAFFYACFAGLALLSMRRLRWLAAGLLAVNLGIVLWRIASGHAAISLNDTPTLTHWLTYQPVSRLLDFMVGMLIYRLPKRGGTAVEDGAGLAAVGDGGLSVAGRARCVADATGLSAADGAGHLGLWRGGGALSGWLSRQGWLVLLGDASFALYLVHLPVVHGGLAVQDWLGDGAMPWVPWAGVVSLVAIALSVAVYRWVEVPVIGWLRPRIDGWFAR